MRSRSGFQRFEARKMRLPEFCGFGPISVDLDQWTNKVIDGPMDQYGICAYPLLLILYQYKTI